MNTDSILQNPCDLKIGFVFTNYNGSSFTRIAIRSLFSNEKWRNCYVVVVDNNSNDEDIEKLKEIRRDYPGITIIFNRENIGYFKGLNLGIKHLRNNEENINYIVVGNNDLCFKNNTVVSIYKNLEKFNKYSVISPNILTMDGVPQNPHVVKKISKFREIIFDFYYMIYYLAIVISKIAKATNRFTDRKDEKQFNIAQTIYQGYGACYILGPLFFQHFDELWAPTFLMGEEFFLSKQLESKKLSIYYEPSIIVNHHFHASTARIHSKKLWEVARQSHKVYRKYLKIWN
jgi:GT2 family glycosyltransferase